MAVRSLNLALVIGNMTRDPELRYTAKGTPIATFGIATNRVYTPTGSTERVETTEFHNIVAWGKLAELCSQLLSKGQKVFIQGRLSTRDWIDEASGKKMYRTEIVAEDMIVLSPPKVDVSEVVEVKRQEEGEKESVVVESAESSESAKSEEVQEKEVPF